MQIKWKGESKKIQGTFLAVRDLQRCHAISPIIICDFIDWAELLGSSTTTNES